jgi:glycosyltransferase involved in cell wall biosynthesis
MITFSREQYLAESVDMFLAQDYKGKKELLILNDSQTTHLECDHPEVRVINWEHRFKDVYDKVNTAVALCKYDLIFPWADDDFYKPWALSTAVECLGGNNFVTIVPYYKTNTRKPPKDKIGLVYSPAIGSHILRKPWFVRVGGYPTKVSSDKAFEKKIKLLGDFAQTKIPDDKAFFTWVVSPRRRKSWLESPGEHYKSDIDRKYSIFRI